LSTKLLDLIFILATSKASSEISTANAFLILFSEFLITETGIAQLQVHTSI
jgi:hypothetical protein